MTELYWQSLYYIGTDKVRVLIVDDHLVIREGLKQLIERDRESEAAVEACSSEEALKLLQDSSHDVVLLGLTLSTIDPIELLKQVRAGKPKLPILVMSVLGEEQYCGRLLRAGASGILTNNSAATELTEALARVSRGRKYISPSLAERLTEVPIDEDISLLDTLSDREYEVMVSLASGKRIKQIADSMYLSIKTVSTYHSRILMKLKLENDAQLIRYAIEQGLARNSLLAQEKLIMSELNIRTAPIISTIKEIWHQRKIIIVVIGILGIITRIVLNYLIRFVF